MSEKLRLATEECMQPSMNIEIHASGMLVRGHIDRTMEGEESKRSHSQLLVMVDATIINR